MSTGIDVLFGTVWFGSDSKEKSEAFLQMLEKHHIGRLDTARQYSGAEQAMGAVGVPSRFVIDTKIKGFDEGSLTKDAIHKSIKGSLEDLGVDKVNILYWHSPDPAGTPVEEGLEAMDQLYKEGKFKYFGLSNFKPEQVKEIYQTAQKKGLVLPKVYQGNYNPVARHYDETLLPLLREYNMSFYAYSPLAGGFLVKSAETLRQGGQGRWDPNDRVGKMYHDRYNRPSLMEALSEWEAIAADAGTTKAELAYRWVRYNSMLKPEHGDAIILGATSEHQLASTLETIAKGPLDASTVQRIDGIWQKVKHEAPTDNFHA